MISTDPSLSEISGGAALTCDPYNVDAIEEGLVRLLTVAELRKHCRTAGPAQAKHYSLENMGHAALEGYKKALA